MVVISIQNVPENQRTYLPTIYCISVHVKNSVLIFALYPPLPLPPRGLKILSTPLALVKYTYFILTNECFRIWYPLGLVKGSILIWQVAPSSGQRNTAFYHSLITTDLFRLPFFDFFEIRRYLFVVAASFFFSAFNTLERRFPLLETAPLHP